MFNEAGAAVHHRPRLNSRPRVCSGHRLRGSGDLDDNGIVTFTELFDHGSNNVRQATNGRQNPQRSGFGGIPFAVVSGGGSQER
ncbi:MAG: hypothetical protein P8L45_12225 [Longimicrobiales bacterium]|nr:hypothetical protein [Longimicrobiales bacterium]